MIELREGAPGREGWGKAPVWNGVGESQVSIWSKIGLRKGFGFDRKFPSVLSF